MHHDTGLVPILLAFMGGHAGRPWDEGELDMRCDLAGVDQPHPGMLAVSPPCQRDPLSGVIDYRVPRARTATE